MAISVIWSINCYVSFLVSRSCIKSVEPCLCSRMSALFRFLEISVDFYPIYSGDSKNAAKIGRRGRHEARDLARNRFITGIKCTWQGIKCPILWSQWEFLSTMLRRHQCFKSLPRAALRGPFVKIWFYDILLFPIYPVLIYPILFYPTY